MSEHAAILFANDAFYIAFASCDYEAMETLWSESETIACIHPGWDALIGRDEVMESWGAIMENTGEMDIRCSHAKAHVFGSFGYVICYEGTDEITLVATNVFVLEGSKWRMVHHQAGPAPAAFDEDDEEEPPETMQ
ncbi:MAG: nuclear transport factor 2 family protein [Rhodospirillaceae bacterium]|nr:nuclear transport factor 2 family protein [Rhodospirillaceae bacterium]